MGSQELLGNILFWSALPVITLAVLWVVHDFVKSRRNNNRLK